MARYRRDPRSSSLQPPGQLKGEDQVRDLTLGVETPLVVPLPISVQVFEVDYPWVVGDARYRNDPTSSGLLKDWHQMPCQSEVTQMIGSELELESILCP